MSTTGVPPSPSSPAPAEGAQPAENGPNGAILAPGQEVPRDGGQGDESTDPDLDFTPIPGARPRATDLVKKKQYKEEGEDAGDPTQEPPKVESEEEKAAKAAKEAKDKANKGGRKPPYNADPAHPHNAPLPEPIKAFGRTFLTVREFQEAAEGSVNIARTAQAKADKAAQAKIDQARGTWVARIEALEQRLATGSGGQGNQALNIDPNSPAPDPEEESFWREALDELETANKLTDPRQRGLQSLYVMRAAAQKVAEDAVKRAEERFTTLLQPHEAKRQAQEANDRALTAFETIRTVTIDDQPLAEDGSNSQFPELFDEEASDKIVKVFRQFERWRGADGAIVPRDLLYHPSFVGVLVSAVRAHKAGKGPMPTVKNLGLESKAVPSLPPNPPPSPAPPPPSPKPAVTGGAFLRPSPTVATGRPGEVLPGLRFR